MYFVHVNVNSNLVIWIPNFTTKTKQKTDYIPFSTLNKSQGIINTMLYINQGFTSWKEGWLDLAKDVVIQQEGYST